MIVACTASIELSVWRLDGGDESVVVEHGGPGRQGSVDSHIIGQAYANSGGYDHKVNRFVIIGQEYAFHTYNLG